MNFISNNSELDSSKNERDKCKSIDFPTNLEPLNTSTLIHNEDQRDENLPSNNSELDSSKNERD